MNREPGDASDRTLDLAIARLQVAPTSPPSGELTRRTVESMLARSGPSASPARRGWRARSIAVAIVVAALGLLLWTDRSPRGEGLAYGDVRDLLRAFRTLHATMTSDQFGRPIKQRMSVADASIRLDGERLTLVVNDRAGSAWAYDRASRLLIRNADATLGVNPIATILDMGLRVGDRGRAERLAGKDVWRFDGTHVVHNVENGKASDDEVAVTIWIDASTRLPVQLVIDADRDAKPDVEIDEMTFGEQVVEGEFDPPKDAARTIDATKPIAAAQLDPAIAAATADDWIEPGVGVGPVRLDAPERSLLEAFGLPERADDNEIRHLSAGLRVVGRGTSDVHIVCVGAGVINGDATLGFAGETKTHVRLGSTSAEVRAAYRTEIQVKRVGPDEDSWSMPDLGIDFLIRKGRVAEIAVYARRQR